MRIRALIGFSGPALSMAKGATAEITDQVILQDLLRAGFIEAVEAKADKEEPKSEGKRTNKKRSS